MADHDLALGTEIRVAFQAGRISDSQLLRQVCDRCRWNVSRINQEGSQEPDRRELNGESEPCVVFAQLINDASVTVVEVKVLARVWQPFLHFDPQRFWLGS
jgi:hypothetical protein